MKNQQENPKGLHQRYDIRKVEIVPTTPLKSGDGIDYSKRQPEFKTVLKPVDPNAEYFVLRLDEGGKDINHIKAGRIAIHAYAKAIEPFIPQLANDLIERYPLID